MERSAEQIKVSIFQNSKLPLDTKQKVGGGQTWSELASELASVGTWGELASGDASAGAPQPLQHPDPPYQDAAGTPIPTSESSAFAANDVDLENSGSSAPATFALKVGEIEVTTTKVEFRQYLAAESIVKKGENTAIKSWSTWVSTALRTIGQLTTFELANEIKKKAERNIPEDILTVWDTTLKSKRLQGTMMLTAGQLRFLISPPTKETQDHCQWETRPPAMLTEMQKKVMPPTTGTPTKKRVTYIVGD